jgi:pyruvate dehydrogenase E2 component (dihydrolipoamide acetyltransferase)
MIPALNPQSSILAVKSGMASVIEVKIPDIGGFKDVPVIEVFVKPGDAVKPEDSLITLESDKATMDVPSPATGMVKELRVKVGDKVSEGSLVLTLEIPPSPPLLKGGDTAPPSPPLAKGGGAAGGFGGSEAGGFAQAHASPSVRRFARELGVDLPRVKGTGPKERITKEDVQDYIKGELSRPRAPGGGTGLNLLPLPQVDFARFGPITTQPLSRIRKLSGANLHRNWVTIPHVTQHDDADITELEEFRKIQTEEAKKQGIRFTILCFLLKAVVVALRQHPEFNASLSVDGESLVLKQYFHVGVAVDTPNGLVVPVIRDVDKKGLMELAKELGEVSARMRSGKILPADLQGGCFSISSLGGLGGSHFTPIINAPEVAILGVGKSASRPVWNGKEFAPRMMLPLSVSYDHRVIDGAQGARFISFLSSVLSDIRRLVL